MKRELRDSVVVITGASSGIGRATALAFAERGAFVVLAARRAEALQELARECEECGVRALAVPTDVRDPEAVETLARRATENFGRIDTWVNNAAVSLFGRFDDVPMDLFREVWETNFFGYVHGARAALPRFREQGAGCLINVSSVVGVMGQPYTTAYVSTKWAIRGFAESLRLELTLDQAPKIQVCTVLPAAIDTPLFQQAGNYSGRVVKPLQPTYDARTVAETIVKVARKPKREVYAGRAGRFAPLRVLVPTAVEERAVAEAVNREHFERRHAPPTPGNIREPQPGWTTIDGGWRERVDRGASERDEGQPAARALALVAAPAAIAAGLLARHLRSKEDGLRLPSFQAPIRLERPKRAARLRAPSLGGLNGRNGALRRARKPVERALSRVRL